MHVRNPASASSLDGEEFLIFSNLEDMFSRAGLDDAIVASAAASHHRITAKALEMGLAVLVEKPFTLSPQSAFELRETAIAKKLVVQVNHVDLANPAWNAVCQQIPSISPLVSLTGAWLGDGPLRPDSPGRWDYGPHAIAVTIDAVGSEPQAVEAHRIKRRGAAEIVEVKMAWGNGVLATVRIGNAESEKQRQIFIRGTRGTLEYDDISETKARKNGEPLEYPAQSPLAVNGGAK